MPITTADEIARCADYLRRRWLTPEDYIIGKFRTHDVVLLAEDHAVRHNLLLTRRLIPLLYAAGVTNFGMEFGASEDQDSLDALTGYTGSPAAYDEAVARRLMFNYNVAWAYREYMDLYRAAWELNRSLPASAPRFRILNLSYRYDWRGFNGIQTPDNVARVFHKGGTEPYRAAVVEREIIRRNEKILILTGVIHAFTRYATPVFDYNADGFCRLDDRYMGNLIDRMIPGRACTILLHRPFDDRQNGPAEKVHPAGGDIDRIMSGFADQRVGFDLTGTPLGDLADDSFYAYGHPDFRLRDLADGYIHEMPFHDYAGCTVDETFLAEADWQTVLEQWPDPNWHPRPTDREAYRRHVYDYVDMARRYADVLRL